VGPDFRAPAGAAEPRGVGDGEDES